MELKPGFLLTNSIRHIYGFNCRLDSGIPRLHESSGPNPDENLVSIYLSSWSVDFNAGYHKFNKSAIYTISIVMVADLHIRTDPISARALPIAYHGI